MRRLRQVSKVLAASVALLLFGVLAPLTHAGADGTEMLGDPSIAIAQGSGTATGGTGLHAQPGTIELAVPVNATIKQVLVYWEGHHYDGGGDDTLVVGGQSVTGTRIGGPTFFFDDNGQVFASSYRADITNRGVVIAGPNTISVSGATFDYGNNGAGILVIYDDGSGLADIQVRDGLDLAFAGFDGARRVTVPQTFTVQPAANARTATLSMMVASVEDNPQPGVQRPNKLLITVGGSTTTVVNAFDSTSGPEWDDVSVPVNLPAGATTVTVEVVSEGDGSGNTPASLSWVSAALAVTTCPALSSTPATTSGSAYGADVRLLGSHPINQAGNAASQAPGTPTSDADNGLPISLVGLVSAKVLGAQSNSSLDPSSTTASSTIADITLLGGLVRATTIRAVSQSTASASGSSFNSNGSTIQGLVVNGNPVTVTPGAKFNVKSLGITIAELAVYEETSTKTFANGTSSASHSVNMLRLELLKPFLGLAAGAKVVLGHAESAAQAPTGGCPDTKSVSGRAFTAFVDGNVGGQALANLTVGEAVLPALGGAAANGTAVQVNGVATSGTATNSTSGSLAPNPNATARSVVQSANVLNGLVTATALDVKSTSSATGGTAGTTFAVNFVNLKVGSITVPVNPPPNTLYILPLPGGFVSVVVNEQTVVGNGTTDTDGTVNAVHVRVYALGGALQGEVIIASAHSDAHV